MKTLTNKQRFDRLDEMIKRGLVLRGRWTKGQERACLLASISPEVGEKQSASACPATVIPEWLSCLTPAMDDNGTLAEWPDFIKRYAKVVRKAAEAAAWAATDAARREAAQKYAEILAEQASSLSSLIGFILDRPINLMGDDGWSVIRKQVYGCRGGR